MDDSRRMKNVTYEYEYYNDRRESLASDLAQRQKADNSLAGSVSAIRDVGLIRSAQQTIVLSVLCCL